MYGTRWAWSIQWICTRLTIGDIVVNTDKIYAIIELHACSTKVKGEWVCKDKKIK